MIYIIAFLLSFFAYKRAVIADERNIRMKRNVMLVLSVLPLLILASCRSISVGTDTSLYQVLLFKDAVKLESFLKFYNRRGNSFEPLYLLVTYLASRTKKIFWMFFINELIILVFMYLTIWRKRKIFDPYLMMATFYFIYYCAGYNIVRQSIAAAILFYAMAMYEEERKFTALLLLIVAVGFHKSAVAGILIALLYDLSKKRVNRLVGFFLFIGAYTFNYFYLPILKVLGNTFSFLPKRYFSNAYLIRKGGYDFNASLTIYCVMCLLIVGLLLLKGNLRSNSYEQFLLYMMVMSVVGGLLSAKATFAYRALIYMEYYSIFVIAQVPSLFVKEKTSLLFSRGLIYVFLVLYWVYVTALNGGNGVYPYEMAAIL